MIAFFFTMPISRMMPISAMTLSSVAAEHQRQERAHAGRRQRGEDRDRVDVALVQHAQHDVDRSRRRQDQQRLVRSEAWNAWAVPWKLPWMLGGQPDLRVVRRWPGPPRRARCGQGDRRPTHEIGLPASIQASFQGTAAAFQASLANEPLLILAALVTVYIVLGVLYESYIHPITILSTLPSAGVGALLALLLFAHRFRRHRAHRHHSADRHRQEERDHDDRLRARGRAQGGQAAATRPSTRPACCASGRS